MSWFDRVLNGEMMWDVDNDECMDALEQLADADSYEKCIVAEGDGHHVIFFEGVVDGETTLLEASISPDWDEVNTGPDKTMAGRVENIFQFSDDWGDIYVSNVLPEALD